MTRYQLEEENKQLKRMLQEAAEAIKIACVMGAVDHKEDFLKAFGKDGIQKLLDQTSHLKKDFSIENRLRDTLSMIENGDRW